MRNHYIIIGSRESKNTLNARAFSSISFSMNRRFRNSESLPRDSRTTNQVLSSVSQSSRAFLYISVEIIEWLKVACWSIKRGSSKRALRASLRGGCVFILVQIQPLLPVTKTVSGSFLICIFVKTRIFQYRRSQFEEGYSALIRLAGRAGVSRAGEQAGKVCSLARNRTERWLTSISRGTIGFHADSRTVALSPKRRATRSSAWHVAGTSLVAITRVFGSPGESATTLRQCARAVGKSSWFRSMLIRIVIDRWITRPCAWKK